MPLCSAALHNGDQGPPARCPPALIADGVPSEHQDGRKQRGGDPPVAETHRPALPAQEGRMDMSMKHWGRTLVTTGLLASAVLLVACSSGGDSKENGNGGSETKASSSKGKAQTIAITMKDNAFEPKDITVEEGAVTFEVKNAGAAIHNMHIISTAAEGKDFSSKPIIEAGTTDKFTATFTKSGTIKFQCDFHLPDMVGTITVK